MLLIFHAEVSLVRTPQQPQHKAISTYPLAKETLTRPMVDMHSAQGLT